MCVYHYFARGTVQVRCTAATYLQDRNWQFYGQLVLNNMLHFLHVVIFSSVMPCNLIIGHRRFERTCCPELLPWGCRLQVLWGFQKPPAELDDVFVRLGQLGPPLKVFITQITIYIFTTFETSSFVIAYTVDTSRSMLIGNAFDRLIDNVKFRYSSELNKCT